MSDDKPEALKPTNALGKIGSLGVLDSFSSSNAASEALAEALKPTNALGKIGSLGVLDSFSSSNAASEALAEALKPTNALGKIGSLGVLDSFSSSNAASEALAEALKPTNALGKIGSLGVLDSFSSSNAASEALAEALKPTNALGKIGSLGVLDSFSSSNAASEALAEALKPTNALGKIGSLGIVDSFSSSNAASEALAEALKPTNALGKIGSLGVLDSRAATNALSGGELGSAASNIEIEKLAPKIASWAPAALNALRSNAEKSQEIKKGLASLKRLESREAPSHSTNAPWPAQPPILGPNLEPFLALVAELKPSAEQTVNLLQKHLEKFEFIEDLAVKGVELGSSMNAVITELLEKFAQGAESTERYARISIKIALFALAATIVIGVSPILNDLLKKEEPKTERVLQVTTNQTAPEWEKEKQELEAVIRDQRSLIETATRQGAALSKSNEEYAKQLMAQTNARRPPSHVTRRHRSAR